MPETEAAAAAAMRWNGAHLALTAASVLVLPATTDTISSARAVVYLAILQLGCAAVLLSPASRRGRPGAPRGVFGYVVPNGVHVALAVAAEATATAMRWNGALLALAAASVLVLPAATGTISSARAVVHLAILELGCAAVLLSPARRGGRAGAPRGAFGYVVPNGVHVALAVAAEATATAMRWNGAHLALTAASVLVLPAATGTISPVRAVFYLSILLLGCASVLLSPAHRAAATLARRAAPAALALRDALRGAFRYALPNGVQVALAVAAVATAMTRGWVHAFVLFLVSYVWVWIVASSVLGARAPRPAAAQELDGREADTSESPTLAEPSVGDRVPLKGAIS